MEKTTKYRKLRLNDTVCYAFLAPFKYQVVPFILLMTTSFCTFLLFYADVLFYDQNKVYHYLVNSSYTLCKISRQIVGRSYLIRQGSIRCCKIVMSTFSAKIRKNGFTVAVLLSTRLARAFAHVLNMSIGKAIITYFPCAGQKLIISLLPFGSQDISF